MCPPQVYKTCRQLTNWATSLNHLSIIIDINGAYYAYYVFTLFNHIATTRGKTMAGDDGPKPINSNNFANIYLSDIFAGFTRSVI